MYNLWTTKAFWNHVDTMEKVLQEEKTGIFPAEHPTSANIRESLKPIIMCMKVFGLYHDDLIDLTSNFNNIEPSSEYFMFAKVSKSSSETLEHGAFSSATNLETQVPTRKGRVRYLAQKCYCVVVMLFLCVNITRFMVRAAFASSLALSFRIVNLMFYLQTSSAVVCILSSCWIPSHFRKFYEQWQEMFSDPGTRSLGLEPTNNRKAIKIITCVALVGISVHLTITLVTLFYSGIPIKEELAQMLCDPFPVADWSLTLAVLMQVFNSAAWLLPLCFVLCLTHTMLMHFNRLNLVIRTHIHQSEGKIPANLKELRKCHLKMCQLLQVLNRFLRSYLATLYLTNLVSCCFILYQLVNNSVEMTTVATNVMMVISNFVTVAAISIGLALMHEAAHAPLEDLFAIETGDADVSEVLQLQLFLSKLTGTSIGATVFSLLVVTKEFLLTTVGAFITYFFLLIQFRI